MKHHVVTEAELRQFEANVRKIKGTVGGGKSLGEPVTTEGNAHRLAPSPKSLYRSKWEAAFANKLELEKQAGLIKQYKYEGISLQLSKGQYHRPDFIVWHLDNSIEMAQVKGWHKNMRAGIKGLKWAAQLHPWFTWTVKRWTGTGWDSNYVEI